MTFRKYTKYAFTLPGEFEKNIQLTSDEKIILQEKVKFYHPITAWLGYLVLTNKRLILLKHYAFWPDIVISIDKKDIQEVKLMTPVNYFGFFNNRTHGPYILVQYLLNGKGELLKFFLFFNTPGLGWWEHNTHGTEKLFETITQALGFARHLQGKIL